MIPCDGKMQRRIGDRIDLPDAFRLLGDKRTNTLDISVTHRLPDISFVHRRTVPLINCSLDGLNRGVISALPQFLRPVAINVLMVLRRNLERDGVGSCFE